MDATFEPIVARASRYPVIMRRGQMNRGSRRGLEPGEAGDPAFRWLLLNTLETNRSLKGTV